MAAMMTCPECGKKMPVGGKCPNCGYTDKGKKAPAKKMPAKKPPAKKGGNPFAKKPY
jgi:tRNA(Ile2) C34 agmatinyltransferase TiaS